MVSSAEPDKKFIEIHGKRMAYVEAGTGDPIIFQHGNPTSSYLWRNIMPQLTDQGRCIAVDLIGMGDSDKLADSGPGSYTYHQHREYLFAAWEALGVTDNVTFVIHDWGSALGFDWASQHPDSVRGIAYMEGIVRPVTWDDWPDAAHRLEVTSADGGYGAQLLAGEHAGRLYLLIDVAGSPADGDFRCRLGPSALAV